MDISAKLEFAVSMSCQSCVEKVKDVLSNNPKITSNDINLCNQQVLVETTLSAEEVQHMIERTGLQAALVGIGSTLMQGHLGAAVVELNGEKVKGVVRLLQLTKDLCLVDGAVDGLPPGPHGLNVHTYGDLSDGCNNCGDHYNPSGNIHGGPNDDIRHVGDLGNIKADESGRAKFRFLDKYLKVYDLIGRSMVIHEKEDDLGQGGTSDGNSGKGIACAIIARSAGLFQNPKRFCTCDGITIWEERHVPSAGEGRQNEQQS